MIAAIANATGKNEEKAFEISYWAMAIFVLISALFPFILKSPPIEKGVTEHTPVVKR